jgi:hypothetical protein
MTDPTLSSTNQSSTNTDVDSLNVDSPKQPTVASSLLDIPCFTPRVHETSTESSLCAPDRIEKEPTFEYEFTVSISGTPQFVTLWDTDDVAACQRACACNVTAGEITYNPKTGIGFFHVRGEDWCFKKQPYQRSWQLHNKVLAEGEGTPEQLKRWDKFTKPPKSSPITADAILATL